MRKTDIEETMQMMQKRFSLHKIAGLTVMVSSVVLILIVSFLAYIPVKVVEIAQPIQILNDRGESIKSINPGEKIFYKIRYRKYKDISGTLSAQLINSYTLVFPSFLINFPKTDEEKIDTINHYDELMVQLDLPKTTMPGKHYVVGILTYQINPLRIQTYTFKTDSFIVNKITAEDCEQEPVLTILPKGVKK